MNSEHPVPKNILLVDDNPHGLVARKGVLAEQGHTVSTALSGEAALQILGAQSFDILVTDYKMQGIDGVHLIARVRELKPEVRTILLSGFCDILGMTEENTKADAVLNKDASELPNLLRAVKRLSAPVAKVSKKAAASQQRTFSMRRA